MTGKGRILSGRQIIDYAVLKALEKKAENIVIYNPGEKSEIADWILICQGETDIQNKAICEAIVSDLKKRNSPAWHKEGIEEAHWILIDYSDAIINILLPEFRDYYNLDELWKSYPQEVISQESD
jgi:ribosome-associated protein